MPKVSVIVPIYRVEKYIERCVRSLFSQTLSEIEYIFIDDCTPDSSMLILNNLIDEYTSIINKQKSVVRICRMPQNSGIAEVRKTAISLATGDYTIHCDSDDWVDNNMYDRLYQEAINTNSDIVICDFYQSTDCEDKYIKSCYDTDIETIICDFISGKGYWSLCNKLIRRSLYDKIECFPKKNMGEDMVLSLQLLYHSKKVTYVDVAYYHYYVNEHSIVRNRSIDSIVNRFIDVVSNVNVIEDIFKSKISTYSFNLCMDSLKYRQLNILLPLIKESDCYNLWKNTFPKIKYRIWFNPYIKFKEKVKFYLRLSRLYRN